MPEAGGAGERLAAERARVPRASVRRAQVPQHVALVLIQALT